MHGLQKFFPFPSIKLGVVGLDPLTLQHLLKGVVVDSLGLHEFPQKNMGTKEAVESHLKKQQITIYSSHPLPSSKIMSANTK